LRAFFQTFTSSLTTTGNVNSQAHAGWSYLAPGKYALEVVSNGAWSIHVRAGVIAPRRAGGRLAYSGSGGATLPPFVVRRAGELAWTCSCHLFQLAGDELRQNVSSQAHGGTTRLQPGTYQLNVNSDGPWSISWRP